MVSETALVQATQAAMVRDNKFSKISSPSALHSRISHKVCTHCSAHSRWQEKKTNDKTDPTALTYTHRLRNSLTFNVLLALLLLYSSYMSVYHSKQPIVLHMWTTQSLITVVCSICVKFSMQAYGPRRSCVVNALRRMSFLPLLAFLIVLFVVTFFIVAFRFNPKTRHHSF